MKDLIKLLKSLGIVQTTKKITVTTKITRRVEDPEKKSA